VIGLEAAAIAMLNAILDGIIPVLIGAALLFFLPRFVHRKIESGKVSEVEESLNVVWAVL